MERGVILLSEHDKFWIDFTCQQVNSIQFSTFSKNPFFRNKIRDDKCVNTEKYFFFVNIYFCQQQQGCNRQNNNKLFKKTQHTTVKIVFLKFPSPLWSKKMHGDFTNKSFLDFCCHYSAQLGVLMKFCIFAGRLVVLIFVQDQDASAAVACPGLQAG